MTRLPRLAHAVAFVPEPGVWLKVAVCLDALFDKQELLARSHLAHLLVLRENALVTLLTTTQRVEIGLL